MLRYLYNSNEPTPCECEECDKGNKATCVEVFISKNPFCLTILLRNFTVNHYFYKVMTLFT